MREITVNLGSRSYPIFIGNNLVYSAELYRELTDASRLMIITDSLVEKIYLPGVMETLADLQVVSHVIPSGEVYKNLDSMNRIITALLDNKFDRTSCLVALGGGVVGDLTGFTAACFQRGIRFLQVPTTLLAQVDSSVGGKTAVNHELGKNMIGAFHQPCGVISDVGVLKTLPDREFRAGLAEVIKYGLIRDREFYEWLESNMDNLLAKNTAELEYAIERSCVNKAEVVSADEKETGLRATLNFGHTFGHAVETGLNYKHWLHGEAVGLGMLMAAYMSMRMGQLNENSVERIYSLISRAGLPVKLPSELIDIDLRELMSVDKKVSRGKLKLVLLHDIGKSVITGSFEEAVLQETIDYFYR